MSGTWITTRAWLLMLPLLIVMVAVIGWPLADTVHLSFTDAKLVGTSGSYVGFDNYVRLISGNAFGRTLFTAKESGWYTPKYSVYLSVGDGEKRDDVAFAREITEYLREVE